jgi:hypothetical protein
VDRGEDADQEEEDDQRDEGADHEDVAMGEIDHSDDAVDHRVADRDQPIDRSQRQPVYKLLDEIFHLYAAPRERRPTDAFLILLPLVLKVSSPDCNVNFSRCNMPLRHVHRCAVSARTAPWTIAKLSLAQRNVFEESALGKPENRRLFPEISKLRQYVA